MVLAFAVMAVTGVVLFIVPQGRVANWSDWRLLGLAKEQWGDFHITTAALFLAAGILHLYFNWSAVVSYLKDRARNLKLFTPAFNLAAVLVTAVLGLTYVEAPPVSWLLKLNDAAKESGSRRFGEPPYGHAEMSSLKLLASRLNLDLEESKKLLAAAGIQLRDENETILEISRSNRMAPRQVFDVIRPASRESALTGSFPAVAPPGLGRRVLADLCAEHGVDAARAVTALAGAGVEGAAAEKTLREMADEAGRSPHDLYDLLRNTAATSPRR
jgi:hypothetical protein